MSDVLNDAEDQEPFSDLEEFKEAVQIAKALIDNGDITFKMSSNLRVILIVSESAIEEKLKESSIDAQAFSRLLRSEIAEMITAVLTKTRESYLRYIAVSTEDSEGEAEGLINQKLDVVADVIVDWGIRHKYLVHATSKVDFLDRVSWEINQKKFASEVEVGSLHYATVRLDVKRTPNLGLRRFSSYSAIMFGSEEPLSVTFDLDLDEISDLISTLKEIRGKLRDGEEKEKDGKS